MFGGFKAKKGRCELCGKESDLVSDFLSLCLDCIRSEPSKALRKSEALHGKAREESGLPVPSRENSEGIECEYCAVNCSIAEGEKGYCGLSRNEDGRLIREFGNSDKAIGSWYTDPHPTNCVSSWCCAGATGSGYPEFAKTPEGDKGYRNAAVFLGSCCAHCLYCQNTDWHRMTSSGAPILEKDELVEDLVADESITCVCWFGGSPEPQAPFVYEVSKEILDKVREDRIFRVGFEVNGNFAWKWLEKIAGLSLKSGGGIKFDLKAWDKNLYRVLTGIDPQPVFENFKKLEEYEKKRDEPPFLRASTLLVPGYIDLEEIRKIARFISKVDTSIPYSLLSYAPAYKLDDQPRTKKDFALTAKNVAENEGLENVRIGNTHLLG
ncbi:MAG: radical SAM protein [Candidatus Thermoplasmatota archaeon]